jgi:hypothetical protein
MADEETGRTDGHDLLDQVWFETIEDLQYIVGTQDDPQVRIKAADVLLRYFVSLGQSINAPYIPDARPNTDDEDDDD